MTALVAADPHPAGRRARDVRRLEPGHRGRVGLEVAEAGHRRQLVGVRDAEHRAGLLGAERAQSDPVGQVRLEAAQPALLQPLRGEQQVQAERAAQAADGHEQVDELRLGREHLGELVDDDEQRRHRREVLAGGPGLLVVADRGEVAGLAQQLLAAHHLAGQRVLHAVDERQLLGQVGDDRRHVRHLGHAGERGTALEVDQHHVELLGGVGHRQPEDQRAQELRLAGSGGADDQAVRAHALLGGLLDVQVHHRAALAEADRHPEPVAGGAGAPGGARLEPAYVAEAEQVHEVRRTGDLAGRGLLRRTGRRGVQRGEPARERLGRRLVALVALGPDRLLPHPQREQRHPALLVGRAVLELQPQPAGVLELAPAGGEVDQGDAVQAVGRDHVVAGRQLGAVGDQDDVRGRRALVGAEPGPVAEVGRQQRREVGERGGDHPHRPHRVALLEALHVGEPLDPVPVGERLVGREYGDDHALRRLERGRRADHRPGQGPGPLLVAAHLDPVEGPQVDRGGQVGLQPVHDQEPVQRGGGRGVDVVDGRRLGRHQLEGERLGAEPVAHVQEVRVGRTVLPHARPVLRQRGQRRRRRGGARSGRDAAGRRRPGPPCARWRDSGGTPSATRSPAAGAAYAAGRSARR